ncbi:MAG: hypothetical protein QOE30_5319 [Mycobacterium sp.]|nr:hypothetical protein [Mycobacterium sp.]
MGADAVIGLLHERHPVPYPATCCKVDDLRAPALLDDQPIVPHPQRVPDQIGQPDRAPAPPRSAVRACSATTCGCTGRRSAASSTTTTRSVGGTSANSVDSNVVCRDHGMYYSRALWKMCSYGTATTTRTESTLAKVRISRRPCLVGVFATPGRNSSAHSVTDGVLCRRITQIPPTGHR